MSFSSLNEQHCNNRFRFLLHQNKKVYDINNPSQAYIIEGEVNENNLLLENVKVQFKHQNVVNSFISSNYRILENCTKSLQNKITSVKEQYIWECFNQLTHGGIYLCSKYQQINAQRKRQQIKTKKQQKDRQNTNVQTMNKLVQSQQKQKQGTVKQQIQNDLIQDIILTPRHIFLKKGYLKIGRIQMKQYYEGKQFTKGRNDIIRFLDPQTYFYKIKNALNWQGVYSLGVVLYQMAYDGRYPYDSLKDYRSHTHGKYTLENYLQNQLTLALYSPYGQKRSEKLNSLLIQLLHKDIQKRPTWNMLQEMCLVTFSIHSDRIVQKKGSQVLHQSLITNSEMEIAINITQIIQNTRKNVNQSITITANDAIHSKEIKQEQCIQQFTFRQIVLFILMNKMQQIIDSLKIENNENELDKIMMELRQLVEKGNIHRKYVLQKMHRFNKKIYKNKFIRMQHSQEKVKEQDTFTQSLYSALIRFPEYKLEVQRKVRALYYILLDVYDVGVKQEFNYYNDPQDDKTILDKIIQKLNHGELLWYIRKLNNQSIQVNQVLNKMERLGLRIQ